MYFVPPRRTPRGRKALSSRVNFPGRICGLIGRTVRLAAAVPIRRYSAGLVLVFLFAAAVPPSHAADLHTLEIVSATGVHVFSVELATNDKERQQGLMYRREL